MKNTKMFRITSGLIRSYGILLTSSRKVHYVQGQSPEPKIREYFYYIDHQGMLFLDDSRMKNFTSCFKDTDFLVFFFKRVQMNNTGRYEEEFPFLSLCGRERNFIRCDDTPIVYTQVIQGEIKKRPKSFKKSSVVQINSQTPLSVNVSETDIGRDKDEYHLSCNYTGDLLTVPFNPEKVFVSKSEGRVYHPASSKVGGVGLIKSSLAFLFSEKFQFDDGVDKRPTHINWAGSLHQLNYDWIKEVTIPLNFFEKGMSVPGCTQEKPTVDEEDESALSVA
ncbi:hypothetical protein J437_LFUL013276 [Ladona fulva]|uniref:Uncharacterized protein n=1 Tax=Ladona fulva TaxID=123851 RepID=A0A8K0KDN1_LADFU|nr:hypothetical protein J437_LFUL013276 [Ladona fulva]